MNGNRRNLLLIAVCSLFVGIFSFVAMANAGGKTYILRLGSLVSGASRRCEIADRSIVSYTTREERPREEIDGITYKSIEYEFKGLAEGKTEVVIYTIYPWGGETKEINAHLLLTVSQNLDVSAESYKP